MMTQLLVSRIRETASVRPDGYVEDVLSHGEISVVGGVEILSISNEALDLLRHKYRDYPAPPPRVVSPEKTASKNSGDIPPSGPGTELKALLKKVGINPSPNCSCNARAKRMDEMEQKEPGWCESHIEEIVGWLREEATKRKLPFIDAAGRLLVRRAIANARRKSALTK